MYQPDCSYEVPSILCSIDSQDYLSGPIIHRSYHQSLNQSSGILLYEIHWDTASGGSGLVNRLLATLPFVQFRGDMWSVCRVLLPQAIVNFLDRDCSHK